MTLNFLIEFQKKKFFEKLCEFAFWRVVFFFFSSHNVMTQAHLFSNKWLVYN